MPLKRSYSSSFDHLNLPAAKLSKQVANLNISDQKKNAVYNDSADMEGVEGPNFTYVNHQDWLDAVNEVVIDDRFTKIPQHIRQPGNQPTGKPKSQTQALILYEPKPSIVEAPADDLDAMEGVEEEG